MAAAKKEKKPIYKTILTVIGNAVLIFLIIIGVSIAFSMLPIKNNYQVLTVMSGSMKPNIPVGSVIVIKPQTTYIPGDVITFKTPASTKKNDYTTHRIVEVSNSDGVITFVTKGDANEDSDREYIEKENIIGKELFAISLVGYLIGYIKTLPGLVLIIIIPAVIIVYEEVRKIHREAKGILERRKSVKKGKVAGMNIKKENEKKSRGKK